MSYEWKVATLEQSKRLVELGIVLETEKHYAEHECAGWMLIDRFLPPNCWVGKSVPAPDVAELGLIISPEEIVNGLGVLRTTIERSGILWIVTHDFYGPPDSHHQSAYKTEAQAKTSSIIWRVENDYLIPEDIKFDIRTLYEKD